MTDIVSNVKDFMHISSGSGTSRKSKRDRLSESYANHEQEIDDGVVQSIWTRPTKSLSMRTRRQKNQQKTKTLFFLNCQIYDSEGAARDPVN